MKNKLIAVARFLLFMGIGFFFIWLFLRNLSTDQRKEIMKSFGYANYWWISLSVALGILSHYLRAIRWRMLLEPMGYLPGKRNTFFAVMIGYIANLALPRLGEVSRCTVLTRYEGVPFNKSFGTVITERAIDLAMFVALFFLNLALQFDKLSNFIDAKVYTPLEQKFHLTMDLSGSLKLIALGGIILVAIIYFIFRKQIARNKYFIKFWNMALGFLEGIKSLVKVKRLWLFAFYSFSIWALYLIMAYLVFFSLPETAHLGIDAGLAALVFGTIGIMVVQGGIGIYPAIVAETLVLYSVVATKGYALGWLIWSSQTITIIILGGLSLIILPIIQKKKNYVEA
ncbi:MAG: flippase-like domain-containing protein [Bacteroidetes bacterium]|nr:flippase-like domain-containing protein [Bacteroidota bacterium]